MRRRTRDTMKTEPITDLQAAANAARLHGGLMVTRNADGTVTYGTPQGDVIHARAAKDLIRLKHVVPVGSDLFGDGEPQLYQSAIR